MLFTNIIGHPDACVLVGLMLGRARVLGSMTAAVGLDPAITIGACFGASTTPFGYDELQFASGLRGQAVELVRARTIGQCSLARAEVVIEGEFLSDRRLAEEQITSSGHAMPEFPSYDGLANPVLPVMRVIAVTARHDSVFLTLAEPGKSTRPWPASPPRPPSSHALEPGLVTQVHAHTAGGGKYLAILQVCKPCDLDDGTARQATIVALTTHAELGNNFVVNDDVDVFDTDDVLWVMTTRMIGGADVISIPKGLGYILDFSRQSACGLHLSVKGLTNKTVYDVTRPWMVRAEFGRAQFLDIDLVSWPAAAAACTVEGR